MHFETENTLMLAEFSQFPAISPALQIVLAVIGGLIFIWLVLGARYIPHNQIGVIEKFWSIRGSLKDGRIISLDGQAGYQVQILRGGMHFFYWRLMYRIHKLPLVVVPEGKIGYIYARDGQALPPEQTLARVVPCNNFQDARAFLTERVSSVVGPVDNKTGDAMLPGQRGRQRAILREGVYAINLALFVVITEENVYRMKLHSHHENQMLDRWHIDLLHAGGFRPVLVGSQRQRIVDGKLEQEVITDDIAIVTVHDGRSLDPGQIIAPPVAVDRDDPDYHNNFQDIEAFLRAGGSRGRQFVTLVDGTYFLNRWFATVQLIPKTVVPIGHVGVVVSYFGREGDDVSGESFRHGERVGQGEKGVQQQTLGPGKYAFNTYAGRVHLVPTTNFVLHWVTGRTETHKFDESLKSIDLVTADAYEPILPLSVVVHLDYEKAPNVIQRFADVKKLITQTLDPLLSAYFRDIAHKKTMLALLHDRDEIQQEAREHLQRRFAEFDIELVDVLIGKPDTAEKSGDIETLLEQLRLRQLSREQIITYQQQQAAAVKLKDLKQAQAVADKQTELTHSKVQVQIVDNNGEADLARSRRTAEQTIVAAEAELERSRKAAEQTVISAEAESKRLVLLSEAEKESKKLIGEGVSARIALEGRAEADVLQQKVDSYGDPRLYALALLGQNLSQSRQPLVPERLFITGNGSGENGQSGSASTAPGMLSTLLGLLVAEKAGFDGLVDSGSVMAGEPTSDAVSKPMAPALEVVNSMEDTAATGANPPAQGETDGASDTDADDTSTPK